MGELFREWIQEKQRKDLAERVIEGCREMADTYQEMEREFHPLELEVDRDGGEISGGF